MINGKKVMAVIPARGGSKRLPHKNLLPLMGKPLVQWSIEAALRSNYIDEVFVSTDDREISNISKDCGAKVPELRPLELSTDTAATKDVILHSLINYGNGIDIVVVLQPTSPLRFSFHIDEALELYCLKKAYSIISVTQCEHTPLWSNTLPENDSMEFFLDKGLQVRSQDLNMYYRLNGAIYIYKKKEYIDMGGESYTDCTFAYHMENINSVDIDTQLDFDYAEFLLKKHQEMV